MATAEHRDHVVLLVQAEPAADAGCDMFLTKPCLPNALVRELRRLQALRRIPKSAPAVVVPRRRRVRDVS